MGQLLWHSHIYLHIWLGNRSLTEPSCGALGACHGVGGCPCAPAITGLNGGLACTPAWGGELGTWQCPWDVSISLHPLTGAGQWPELHVPLYLLRLGT